MDSRPRILLGIWLFLLSGLSLAHLVWAWSFTSRLVPATTAAGKTASIPHIRVHWLGIGFAPTLDASLVLLVLLAAIAGSSAHMALVFSNRVGHNTLEKTWSWWYLLRPSSAAIVGVVGYIVLKAGFLGTVNSTDQHSLAFAAGVGALAGMFTDTLIKKLAGALGATPFDEPATGTTSTS